MGKGFPATPPGLDLDGECEPEWDSEASAGGHLSMSVRGGDLELETAPTQLPESPQELYSKLLLERYSDRSSLKVNQRISYKNIMCYR